MFFQLHHGIKIIFISLASWDIHHLIKSQIHTFCMHYLLLGDILKVAGVLIWHYDTMRSWCQSNSVTVVLDMTEHTLSIIDSFPFLNY